MDMISWLFNFVPWWIYVVVIVVLITVGWQFISPIWLMLPKPVKIGLVFLATLLTAYIAGRNRGSKDERAMNVKRDVQANNTRNDIHAKIEKLDTAAVDKRLGKWVRD